MRAANSRGTIAASKVWVLSRVRPLMGLPVFGARTASIGPIPLRIESTGSKRIRNLLELSDEKNWKDIEWLAALEKSPVSPP